MMAKAPLHQEPGHEHPHPHPPHPHPPHPDTLDAAYALIDSQARVITTQAILLRQFQDLVRFYPPKKGNGNGEED